MPAHPPKTRASADSKVKAKARTGTAAGAKTPPPAAAIAATAAPSAASPDATGTSLPRPQACFYRPSAYAIYDSVGFLMKHVMMSIVGQADKRLGEHGLTNSQWGPLMRLRMSGESTVAELARWLQIDAGATTRLLDRLEKKGLCRRIRSTADRRVVRVAITPDGEAAIAEVPTVLSAIMNEHLVGFSEAEWRLLLSFLQRMLRNGEVLRGPD